MCRGREDCTSPLHNTTTKVQHYKEYCPYVTTCSCCITTYTAQLPRKPLLSDDKRHQSFQQLVERHTASSGYACAAAAMHAHATHCIGVLWGAGFKQVATPQKPNPAAKPAPLLTRMITTSHTYFTTAAKPTLLCKSPLGTIAVITPACEAHNCTTEQPRCDKTWTHGAQRPGSVLPTPQGRLALISRWWVLGCCTTAARV